MTQANGYAERPGRAGDDREAGGRAHTIRLGADTGYDAADFVNELRAMNVRPQVARNTNDPAL